MLGTLEIDGDRPVGLAPRAADVLTVLALHSGKPVSPATIEAFIWGEHPPNTSRKVVQGAVSALRRLLGPDRIETTERGYALWDIESVDLQEFEQLCRRGHDLLREGEPWAASETLSAGLALWRGEPLETLLDSSSGQSAASVLVEERLLAEEDLVDARLACGEHRSITPTLAAAVEAAPLRERRWMQLMLALYRCDRKAEALSRFRELEQLLGEELGVDPSPEAIALEESILLNKPELEWNPDDLPSGGPQRPDRERQRGRRFVGRRVELAQLRGWLAESALVTITGPGGIGKTRLATQAAESASAPRDGVVVVELAAIDEASAISSEWVHAAALHGRTGANARETLLEAAVGLHQLVVLDNCEHLLDGCRDLVSSVLDAGPNVRILATSREPLGLDLERVVELGPMSLPDAATTHDPDEVLRAESVALLFDRWDARDPTARVDAETAPLLCSLANKLEGLPLALELAAARLPGVSLADLDARLGSSMPLLDRETSSLAHHQATLRATIGWSYDLLGEHDRVALNRLSMFADGCRLNEAEHVLALGGTDDIDVVGSLESLVAKSLVKLVHDGSTGRYRLLELVREFAAERVSPDERDQLADLHARAYLPVAEWASDNFFSLEQPTVVARVSEELENFRRARRHLMQTDEPPFGALNLAVYLHWPLLFLNLVDEADTWIETAWDDAAPPELRGWACAWHSGTLQRRLEWDRADEVLDRGLEIARETENPALEAVLLFGRCFPKLNRLHLLDDATLADVDRAIELSRRAGGGMPQALQLKGNLLRERDLVRARELLEEALDLARVMGPTAVIPSILCDLMAYCFTEDRIDEALELAAEVLSMKELVAAGAITENVHNLLGYARYQRGELDAARDEVLTAVRLGEGRPRDGLMEEALVLALVDASRAPRRAARCLGIARGILNRNGYDPDWIWRDVPAVADQLKHKLGDEAFDDAVESGRSMPQTAAVAFILEMQ